MTSGAANNARDRLAEQLEVARFADQTGPDERQVIVVRRNAFEYPEQSRMHFARQVVRRERDGLQSLYVPEMEIFMADEAEECAVAIADLLLTPLRQIVT